MRNIATGDGNSDAGIRKHIEMAFGGILQGIRTSKDDARKEK